MTIQGCERDIAHLHQELKQPFNAVLQDAQLFRLSLEQERYIFARHDRLNLYLMARAIKGDLLNDNFDLSDPYFAEVIGMACVLSEIDECSLYTISLQNSLVAFYCYAFSVKIKPSYKVTAIKNIQKWLSEPNHQTEEFEYQIYASLRVLNEVFDDSVPTILNTYSKKFHNYIFNEVSFKYGDLSHGLSWLLAYPFHINISTQKPLIDYVLNKYGNHLIPKICQFLEDKNGSHEFKSLLFQLIGYTENSVFANSLRTAFKQTPEDKLDYRMFFWASARVCDDDPESLLEPVFDYWERLSDEKSDGSFSEKSKFATYSLDFKFRDYIPHSSISYILEQAEKRPNLYSDIFNMLRDVDNPEVLAFIAQHFRDDDTENYAFTLFNGIFRNRDYRQSLSKQSKAKLLEISNNSQNDQLKKIAFKLWETSINQNDLYVLQKIEEKDIRYDTAIMGRAKRSDITVVDELIPKLKEGSDYWWQATRYIWHKKIEDLFEANLAEIASSKTYDLAIIFEQFDRVSNKKAEELLVKYWNGLSVHKEFIHVALSIATPKLNHLIQSKLMSEANVADILNYFTFTIGFRTKGRKGIYRIEQMEALQPYFKYLDDMKLSDLSEICLENGWRSFINDIEPLIKEKRFRHHVELQTSDLDKVLTEQGDFTYYWISSWINDRKKEGWSHAEVVNALFDWFNKNRSEKSLGIISKPLIEDGTRDDDKRLKEELKDIEDWSTKDKVLKQIYFCVYSRTLN